MRSLLISTALLALPAYAQDTKVLFLGNSYTAVNDLPNTLRELALSLGDTVEVGMSAPGGYALEDHLGYAPSLAAIASQPWDYVVMQEQSQWGALIVEGATTTASAAVLLCNAIEANYECTYPVFYMTWGHENGDAFSCPTFPSVCTYTGMQQNLRQGYLQVANYNNGYVSPVGEAWKQVRATHPLIDLYQPDGSHPTVEGTYLAACVFYCTLFQQDCINATFTSTLQPDTAAILRQIASSTVLDSVTTWNLDVANGTNAIWSLLEFTSNSYTLFHPGQGTHYWEVSDGDTSTSAQPTFVFPADGWYTITHIYTDPCGNTDTLVSPPFEVYFTGVEEAGTTAPYQVQQTGAGTVEVTGCTGRERLALFDMQGRLLVNERIGGSTAQVACPSGLLFWTVTDGNGMVMKGKVVVR